MVGGAPQLRRRRRTAGRLSALAVAAAMAAACGSTPGATGAAPGHTNPAAVPAPPATTSAPGPALCGTRAGHPAVDKVMVIFEENQDYSSIIGSGSAPYLNLLARRCGLATDYLSATHPSLPNYLQSTSAASFARYPFNTDCSPGGSCTARVASIFGQETAAGHQWRSYEESMGTPCDKTTSGLYAARHNPAVYYPALGADCRRWDVPMGTTGAGALRSAVDSGSLPAFSVVTPNVVDDMHDGTIAEGDSWLARWMPVITGGPDYRAGRLAVFVVWDETAGDGYRVPLIVASQSTPAGARVGGRFTEDSLVRTVEALTGVSGAIGGAARAPSLAGPFGL